MAAKLRKTEDENLYLDEESGHYIWREYIGGAQRWKSTGTDKVGLARQQVKVFRAEATGTPLEKIRRTFDEAFDVTLKVKSAKGAKTHISAKTQIEGHLRPWFREHCPYLGDFERAHQERWAEYRLAQAEKDPTRKLKHDREILLFALKRAREKGWIKLEFGKKTKDGKFGLELNESTESIGRALEDDEANHLLRACSDNPTLELQVRMALTMGMRLREILHLRWDEFDWKTGEVVVRGARVKTRRGRRVPIHTSVLKELKVRLKIAEGPFVFPARRRDERGAPVDPTQAQDDNSNAFGTARARAARAWAKEKNPDIADAELERVPPLDCRFHDLRHTFMTNAMAEGLQPANVSQITGASLKVVMGIYHHLKGDVRERARNLFSGKFVGGE